MRCVDIVSWLRPRLWRRHDVLEQLDALPLPVGSAWLLTDIAEAKGRGHGYEHIGSALGAPLRYDREWKPTDKETPCLHNSARRSTRFFGTPKRRRKRHDSTPPSSRTRG